MKKINKLIEKSYIDLAEKKISDGDLLKLVKKGNKFFAKIDDNGDTFYPSLEVDDENTIVDIHCQCKESNEEPCIHLYTALLGIKQESYSTVKETNKLVTEEYINLINSQDIEKLRELVIDYANNSNFFTNVSQIYFDCTEDEKERLMELTKEVNETVNELVSFENDEEDYKNKKQLQS